MAKTKSADDTRVVKAAGRESAAKQDGGVTAAAKPAKPATESRGAPAPADPPAVKEASVSPRARKAAAEKAKEAPKAAAAAKKPARRGVAAADAKKATADFQADLRAFAEGRPQGWDHADWLAFLDHLRERGHDVSDEATVGLALERERLAVLLERVQGMGPKRVRSLVERFDTVWSLRQAGVDDLATVPGMNLSLAEKVRQAFA